MTDTIVVCAIGSTYAGYLLLSDTLKEDAVSHKRAESFKYQ